MGRPKGSKNKVQEPKNDPLAGMTDAPKWLADHRDMMIAGAAEHPPVRDQSYGYSMSAPSPKATLAPPDHVTIPLTDEDLAPAREAKARHERAAAKYQKQEIASELRRKEIGEIEELSVPQVVPFDLSAAFTKIAQQKARAAGYRFAHNLRKTPEGWVFEASNSLKVKNDAPSDQP
jgi:hypothetical protein